MKSTKFQRITLLILGTVLCWSCGQNNTLDKRKMRLEAEIRDLMLEFIEEIDIPAMGLGYYSDTIGTVMLTVGKSDVENNTPLEISTHYPIQSTSKMFMSILTLQLVEEGKLTLDSTIDEWMDYVPNGNLITIKDLLKHTSGLVDYQANSDFIDEYWSYTGKEYSRDDFIHAGLEVSQDGELGVMNYSNTNYHILANIIEEISQHSIGQELDQRIFRPADMNDTYYKPEITNDTNEIVTCYRNGDPIDLDRINFSSNAAGGIVSTIGDMLKFAQWVMDNNYQIPMISELTDVVVSDKYSYKYGLGIQVDDKYYSTNLMGHPGGNPGLLHEFYFSTETGEIILYFFNEGNPREYFPIREKLDTILQKYR
jgi:D-alanyl-D-alanine carboxypeptidase